MAKQPKLKVYRTAIGFHDAYVAAPSKKAALAAWGSNKNLFARGAAELVEDPKLAEEPLASPGKVIRKLRGTTEEQLAALPRDGPKKSSPAARRSAKMAAAPPKPRPPRPSRAALDTADAAVTAAERAIEDRRDEMTQRERELADERRKLEADHAAKLKRLRDERARQEAAYEEAVQRWRKDNT